MLLFFSNDGMRLAMVCERCNGARRYLGNGFMMTDCNLCNDKQNTTLPIVPIEKIDRRSKSYKIAIKEIMNLDQKITRQQAEKMFDESYAKS